VRTRALEVWRVVPEECPCCDRKREVVNVDRTRLRCRDLLARLESCCGVELSGRSSGEGIRAAVSCGGRLGRTGKTRSQCTRSPALPRRAVCH